MNWFSNISNLTGNLSSRSKANKKEADKLGGKKTGGSLNTNLKKVSKVDFKQSMNREATKRNLDVQKLIAELEEKSSKLKNGANYENYLAYRNFVKEIFKSISSQTFELSKVTTLDQSTEVKKEYHFMRVVNQELDSLLQLIQEREQKNLQIVKKLIKINGLIVNYLV